MTYEESKKIIAEKHRLGKTLVTGHRSAYFDEAAKLYDYTKDTRIEALIMEIDEFLDPIHPIRHSNHYLHFKKQNQ